MKKLSFWLLIAFSIYFSLFGVNLNSSLIILVISLLYAWELNIDLKKFQVKNVDPEISDLKKRLEIDHINFQAEKLARERARQNDGNSGSGLSPMFKF